MYYLAIGNPQKLATPLAERYQQVPAGLLPVVRDLSPHQPHPSREELPAAGRPYQRLNDWRWAVPEVFTFLEGAGEPCLLLSNAPLDDDGVPWGHLAEHWPQASALQQLGWLSQIAKLWDPCVEQKVASSLLLPANIGVQGWQMRLFYLKADAASPTLRDLAACWRTLSPLSAPLASLVGAVEAGQVNRAADLVEALESMALLMATGRVIQTSAATDVGRRRKNNEDCFAHDPAGRYAVVCDGMGGHEGGEVASRMATESLERDLGALAGQGLTPREVRSRLAEALGKANAQLWETNQQQRRNGTGRMGTTVVACYQDGALLHVAHVGDSRIYLVNRKHCQQITVDHDLTQKEISRARTTSAAAALIPTGGTLTQALGLMPEGTLQPMVQSFILPEECLVLLCSDGLCDGDLVERSWKSALRPLLDRDLAPAAPALIDLALRELGHDNITFVLLRYMPGAARATDSPPTIPQRPRPQTQEIPAAVVEAAATTAAPARAMPAARPTAPTGRNPWLPIATVAGVVAVAAGAYLLLPQPSVRREAPTSTTENSALRPVPVPETGTSPPTLPAASVPIKTQAAAVGPAPKPANPNLATPQLPPAANFETKVPEKIQEQTLLPPDANKSGGVEEADGQPETKEPARKQRRARKLQQQTNAGGLVLPKASIGAQPEAATVADKIAPQPPILERSLIAPPVQPTRSEPPVLPPSNTSSTP
ncbi:protein phosphatase 2C domain-containing protein [Gloeobacter morelensis]|uniref:protein phosphatase 2C domain-containing protein n=1 Tax=Gloeobacter morelensis TaxID=2907343 RepID=UPI001E390A86|nr:protein phosphatase 2C domain-containing protein [Gloeobacter morelensis]